MSLTKFFFLSLSLSLGMEVCVLVRWSVIAKSLMVLPSFFVNVCLKFLTHTEYMFVICVDCSPLLTWRTILLNAEDVEIKRRWLNISTFFFILLRFIDVLFKYLVKSSSLNKEPYWRDNNFLNFYFPIYLT